MSKFFTILKILLRAKITFFKPSQYQIIIYDDVNDMFSNILKKKKYIPLQVRDYTINTIYLNYKIIFNTFKIHFENSRIDKINFYTAYLVSVIIEINPKIVLTAIDNSIKFSEIAKILHKEIYFIAVQNAARYDYDKFSLLFKKKITQKNLNKKYFIPHYYCFGEFEKKNCKKNKIKVQKFYCYGSLKLSNYLKKIKVSKKVKKKYDVALISEASIGKNLLWKMKGIDEAFAEVAKFTIKFCKDNNYKFVFLTKRPKGKTSDLEFNFYKKFLSSEEYKFLLKNSLRRFEKNQNNYNCLNQSEVAIGVCSTMLREKIALGGKIINCDFTPLKFYNSPFDDRLKVKKKDYSFFERKVKKILNMSKREYLSILKKQNLINQDFKKLTFQHLNQQINKIIYD